MCFCFVFGAQAQITKIDTYSNKIKGLSAAQKDGLDLLFFGSVPKIFISEQGKSIMLWTEKGSVKTVELNYKQIQQLKDESLSISYKSVEVISVTLEKGKSLELDESYISNFPNLKYLLINCPGKLTNDDVKSLLGNLTSSSSVSKDLEVILNETSTSS